MIRLLPIFTLAVMPQLAFAQPTTFAELVRDILGIIDIIIPALFALAMIVIFWGVFKGWILNVGDERARSNGKNVALIGVIVFVVMVSIWGIVTILRTSLFG